MIPLQIMILINSKRLTGAIFTRISRCVLKKAYVESRSEKNCVQKEKNYVDENLCKL